MFNLSYLFRSIFLIGLILSASVRIYAQTEEVFDGKKNILKISPQSFIASTFLLSYERYLSTGTSLQLSGGILSTEKNNTTSNYNFQSGTTTNSKNSDKANGGTIEGILKFYFLKGNSIMSGMYAGPYGKYTNNRFRVHTDNYQYAIPSPTVVDYRIESYEGGIIIGYQFVIRNVFVMDLFTGGGVKSSNNSSPATYTTRSFNLLESQDYNGVVPRAGFRLGFAF